jgi:putative CocE/NonD family hydrolase
MVVSRVPVVVCSAVVLLVCGLAPRLACAQASSPPPAAEATGTHPDVVKQSVYIAVRDGTMLAADIFRPATGNTPVDEPLPLVWTLDRFHRASVLDDEMHDTMGQHLPRGLVRHGYVVAAVDGRGTGASFGAALAPFHPNEMQDSFDVMAWFARQPWCDGNIGMFGYSYMGASQYLAAASGSPHLKAIVPSMAMTDLYAWSHPGGVFRRDFLDKWTAITHQLDVTGPPDAAPVDGDDGTLVTAARAEHVGNPSTAAQLRVLAFRDNVEESLRMRVYEECSPIGRRADISDSGVATLIISGWFDCFTLDAITMFANLDAPRRLIVGPWFHYQRHGFDVLAEHLRWYDHWLKGIDNGVMDDAPVRYFTMTGATPLEDEDGAWRTSDRWPLAGERRVAWHFHGGGEDEAAGRLAPGAPAASVGPARFEIDYDASMGPSNRWANGYGGPAGYVNLADNDARGLTHTSEPLARDLEVTGHPVVHLWVGSTAPDGDFFVYLEEVSEDGYVRYVSEGVLRASHRATHEPPVERFGLPWHRSYAGDVEPLPQTPVELVVELLPTSNVFNAGNRIRVTVTGADAYTHATVARSPAPLVSVYRSPERPSRIVLPIVGDGPDLP